MLRCNKLSELENVQIEFQIAIDILYNLQEEYNELRNVRIKLEELRNDVEDVKEHILAFEDDDEYDDSRVDDWHDVMLLRKYGEQL